MCVSALARVCVGVRACVRAEGACVRACGGCARACACEACVRESVCESVCESVRENVRACVRVWEQACVYESVHARERVRMYAYTCLGQ
jgi:hypothetical protein